MFSFAPLLLRSLLTSIVGMLVVVGAVHAHGRGDDDCDRHAHRPASKPVLETPSGHQAGFVQTARASVAVTLNLHSVSVTSTDPCEQGECDHGVGGGCCAMSCHAAVGGAVLIIFNAYRPPSLDPLMSTPSLHGRVVGPGDHPPRSA